MGKFRASIFGRVVLSFILLVALPTLGLLGVFSQTALATLYQASASQARETGSQILRSLAAEAEMVSYQAAALLYNPDLATAVDRYAQAGNRPEQAVAALKIDQTLIGFLNLTNRAGTIGVLSRKAGWYSYGNLTNPGALAAEAAPLVAVAEASPGSVAFQDEVADRTLTAVIAPGIGEQDGGIRCLVLRLRSSVLADLRNEGGSRERTDVVLLGRRNQVLVSSLDERTLERLRAQPGFDGAEGEQTRALEGQVWLTSAQRVEATGWRLITLRNEASLTGRFQLYGQGMLAGLLVLVALFSGYAWLVFSRIASPIHHVADSMDRVGRGDWGFRIPNPGLRDLDVLVDSFNRMSGEIVRLNKERVSVELEALRHQINPHFLANTLNVVRLMASTARMKAIETITADLMALLSDSYGGGTSLTELASEIRNIESYVRIMQVRFDTGFDLAVEVEPETRAALTPRMLLQPLVENAILHGFAGLGRRGRVTLRGRIEARPALPEGAALEAGVVAAPDQALLLEIEDNGVGMDASRVPEPSHGAPDRLGRIGLDNVARRLALTFGAAGSLQIASERGVFTRVTLTLPLLRRLPDA